MRAPTPGMESHSRTSALSTSFDFGAWALAATRNSLSANPFGGLQPSGDLVDGGEGGEQASEVEKQGARGFPTAQADRPLQRSSILLPPASASFDFGDFTDGSKSPSATASPMVVGESSTAKRLQRLLESTEWRSLPAPAPERSSQQRQDRGDHQPLGSSSSSLAPPSSASRNSIELVYDPVLRCYYDPVADKYYALAK